MSWQYPVFSVERYLTAERAAAGDFISWSTHDSGSIVWIVRDRAAWTLQVAFLGLPFNLPRAPTSPLVVRLEANGRTVARIPVRPQIERTDQGGLFAYIRLSNARDRDYPPHGPVPALGTLRRLVGTLEERGGRALATVSVPLPDEATMRGEGRHLLQRVIEKAADPDAECRDRRQPVRVPPPPPR